MHLLALCVLQNLTVVNVNQDLRGANALCPYDLPGPGCTTAAVRVEQDLQEEKKSWVASCLVLHTHWRVVRFTEGSLLQHLVSIKPILNSRASRKISFLRQPD